MIFYIYMPACIHSREDSYFEYITEGNTAVITGLKPDAKGLKVLEIPSVIDGFNVVGLGEEAFSYMDGVEAFEVDPQNAYYASEDGVLFSKDKKVLLDYPHFCASTCCFRSPWC